jgi:hypothetical protein
LHKDGAVNPFFTEQALETFHSLGAFTYKGSVFHVSSIPQTP